MSIEILVIPINEQLICYNEYEAINRRNKYAANSKKKDMIQVVCDAVFEHFKGKSVSVKEEFYPLHVHFDWFVSSRRRDTDNIRFSAKFILDGFQVCGLIKNDNLTCINMTSDTYTIDKEHPRVIVTLKPSHLTL